MTDEPAGTNGPAAPRHAERLWPSPGVWAVGVGLGAAMGLVTAPLGAPVAVVTAVCGAAAAVAFLIWTTPRVVVSADRFVAGRAEVPVAVLGDVEVLDAPAMRHARGPGLDARAFLCLRGWLPAGVRVQLRDEADPTPYWLVSSRRPAELAATLTTAITSVS